MTIKVCHNKFRERLDKASNVMGKIVKYFEMSIKYVMTVLFFISVTQFSYDPLWMIGILVGGGLGFLSWFIHLCMPTDDNDFVKLNRKLKLFGWREDC